MTLEVKTPGKAVTEVLVLIVVEEEKEKMDVPRKVAARWGSVSIIAIMSKLLLYLSFWTALPLHSRILEHVIAATPNSRRRSSHFVGLMVAV